MRHSSSDLRAVLDIIDAAYSIPNRSAMFHTVCERIERLIGVSSMIYIPTDAGAEEHKLSGYELFNTPESAMLMYVTHYHRLDPYVIKGLPCFANAATRITDLKPKRLLLESEFGADFLLPMANVFYILGSTLVCEGDSVGVFALHREKKDADFSDRESSIVNILLPHVARAARNSAMIKTMALEYADPGVIILDDGGRPVYMNKEAREALKGRPPAAIPRSGAGPGFLKSGSVTYRVRTLPAGCGRKGSIILLERHPQERRLGALFAGCGLSGREEETASLAIQGLSNAEIAQKLFVAEQTVKDHLKEVFKKMGVRKRSELAAKALGLPGKNGLPAMDQ